MSHITSPQLKKNVFNSPNNAQFDGRLSNSTGKQSQTPGSKKKRPASQNLMSPTAKGRKPAPGGYFQPTSDGTDIIRSTISTDPRSKPSHQMKYPTRPRPMSKRRIIRDDSLEQQTRALSQSQNNGRPKTSHSIKPSAFNRYTTGEGDYGQSDAQDIRNYIDKPALLSVSSSLKQTALAREISTASAATIAQGFLTQPTSPNNTNFNLYTANNNTEGYNIRSGIGSQEGIPQIQIPQGMANGDGVINACPQHPDKEIKYISKQDKEGFCYKCVQKFHQKGHDILSFEDTVNEVRTVLISIEMNMTEILKEKTTVQNKNYDKQNQVESQKAGFLQSVKNKVDRLKAYLDEKLEKITHQFNGGLEHNLVQINHTINTMQSQIEQNNQFMSQICGLRKEFEQSNIPNIMTRVNQANIFLQQYNEIKENHYSGKTSSQLEINYPSKLQELVRVLDMDHEKEIKELNSRLDAMNRIDTDLKPEMPIIPNELQMMDQPGSQVVDDLINNTIGSGTKDNVQSPISGSALGVSAAGDIFNASRPAGLSGTQGTIQSNPTQQSLKTHGSLASGMNLGSPNKPSGTITSKQDDIEKIKEENQAAYRRRIRVVRWMSKKVGEFDVDGEYWSTVNAQVSMPFLPFSRTVYLPNKDMVVLGGLNDEIPQKPTFSSQATLLSEMPLNDFENLYVPMTLNSMHTRRGSFAAIYHEGYIYVFGGINHSDRVLKKVERYNVNDNVWDQLTCMVEPRKNASACALTSDTIYIFGGTSNYYTCDSIEQFSTSSNTWILLRLKMPNPISFLVTFKVTNTKILLLGGSIKENSMRGRSYKTNQVLEFNAVKPDLRKVKPLEKDLLSLYPGFYDRGILYLIDEDGQSDKPVVLKYSIEKYVNMFRQEPGSGNDH